MNAICKVVWSQVHQQLVVVSELVKAGGKTHSRRSGAGSGVLVHPTTLAMAMALGLGLTGASAQTASNALPVGGNVAAGTASISQSGANMVIDQSTQRAVINWQSFNVGKEAHVQFNNGSGATLNRVNGPEASTILGRISATGQITISNGNGVFFGRGSRVDVGSLVATTHSISDDAFMAGGPLRFERNGSTASVVNEGELSASLQGYVALLAPEVRNSGVIVANKGTVALAAGDAITLQLNAQDQLQGVVVEAGDWQAMVDNRHVVEAEGGLVILSARALQSVQGGVVRHSGRISASSLTEVGGRILLTGDDITLASGSRLEATGATGGGEVLVGGDWQGGQNAERRVFEDPNALNQATTVTMEQGASIDASATANGQGGTVVLWSDVHNANSVTHAAGSISAKGAGSGGGGQVETSGHQLDTPESVRVDTTDAQGRAGVWLLDPYNYTIAASGGQFTGAQLTTLLNSSNIEISTADSSSAGGAGVLSNPWGRIYVDDSFTVPIGKTLTLKAHEFTSTISTSSSPGGIGINNQGTLIFDQFTGLETTKQFWVPINNAGNITFIGNRSSSVQADFSMDMNRYLSPSNGSITVRRGTLTIGSDLVLNGKLTLGGAINGNTVDTFKVSGALTANGGVDLVDYAAIQVDDNSSLSGLIENSLNKTLALQLSASNKFIELDASYSNPIQFTSKPNTTVKFLGNNPLGTLAAEDNGILFIDIPGTSRTLSNLFRSVGALPANASLQFTSGKTLILTNTANNFTGTAVVPDNSTFQVGAGSTGVYTGKVNLVGANSIYRVNSASNFTTSTITGLGQLIKSGSGTLLLNGSNTYSGVTTINSGGVTAAHANALGSNSTGTTVLGGFLGLSGGITLAEPIIFDANNTYLSGISGTNIFSGSLVVNGSNLNLESVGGILQVNSAITGNFGIVKTSTGTVILNGNNDFTGSVTINGGVLVAAHNNALGSAASGTTVNVTAALGIQGDIALMEPITINGSGYGSSGSLSNRSGSNSLSGPITMTANGQLSSTAGTLTVNAPISGAFNIEKKGLGIVVLAGNNTYEGSTTVTEGTLVAAHSSALGSAANGTSVASGATLALQGDISIAEPLVLNGTGVVESTVAKGALRNLSGNNTVTGAIILNSHSRINSDAGTLTIDVSTGNAITGANKNIAFGGAGNITVVDALSLGSGTQSIDSTGTVTLPAATLTPTQIGLLTTADVAALSPQQIAAFDNDQMAAFTATQITGLSTIQQAAFLANLNASQLAGMSNTALAAIDPVKLASLATGMLGSLSPTKMGQLTAAQLAALSASSLWTELSTAQVAGLTATQLTGLSSAQVAGFTADQLGGLTATQLSALSAAQQTTLLSGLTAAKLAGISNAALAAIEPSTLAGFASGKLSSLSAAKIGQLSSAQLIQLSASSLWTELSTAQVAGLTAAQLTVLSSAQVAGFTAAQLGGLTATQLSGLSAAQQTTLLSGLTAAKLAGISNATLAAIEPSTLAGFASGQLASLSAAQIGQFSSAQLIQLSASGLWTELSTAQVAGLTAAQLTGLSSAQVAGFTAAQLGGLTATQLSALSAAQQTTLLSGLTAAKLAGISNAALAAIEPSTLAGFASGQLSSLSATQIGQFSSAQLIQLSASGLWTELSTAQVAGLTAAQLTGLSSAQVAGFTAAQLGGLTATQLSALSAAQQTTLLSGLTAAKLAGISNAALAAIEPSTLAGFASGQLSSLSAAQIGQFSSAQLIQLSASGLWAELSTAQVAGLTATQLTGLSSAQLAGFTAAQLAGLSSAQVAVFSVAQLGGLTDTQRSALSGAQNNQSNPPQVPVQAEPVTNLAVQNNQGNPPQDRVQTERPVEAAIQAMQSSARASTLFAMASVAVNPAARVSSADIKVELVRSPELQTAGLVTVSMPSDMAASSAGFAFALPNELFGAISNAVNVDATLVGGQPLPSWLQFDSTNGQFWIGNVANVSFPLEISVQLGTQVFMVVISVRSI